MPREVSGASLTQSAYERLRADLLACRLRPGERLRIGDLCTALGVSLSAVREALSRLTAEGLVVAEPQRGFRAAPISESDLHDLTAARIEIETLCLRRSLEAGDVDWEERLVAAHYRLSRIPERDPGDPRRVSDMWAEAHGAYHAALVAGCDNAWLLRLRAILYAQSERYRRLSVPLARAERDLLGEHREIMETALAHKVDHACALLAAHLATTSAVLLRADDQAVAPALATGA
jgi:DNA-binding GntR family transcriptional regulator